MNRHSTHVSAQPTSPATAEMPAISPVPNLSDGLGCTAEDRARWLYTVITRAERGLVILD